MVRGILFTLAVIVLLASAGPVLASTDSGNGLTAPLATFRDDAQLMWGNLRSAFDTEVAGIWFGRVVELFGLYAVAAVLVGLFRASYEKVMAYAEQGPIHNAGYGLVGILGAPIITVLLALTLIGIPLAIGLAALWVLLALLACITAGWIIGRLVMRHLLPHVTLHPFWEAVIGITLVVVVLEWFPQSVSGTTGVAVGSIAWLTRTVFVLWAAGAVMRAKVETIKKGYA